MTGCYSMGHFVNELSDIAFSINLILVKFICRVVPLLGVLSGNCIVVEVALNRIVIAPAVSSIDVWNIALSLSFISLKFLFAITILDLLFIF